MPLVPKLVVPKLDLVRLLSLGFLLLTACAPAPSSNAVYVWKSETHWSPIDTALLERDGVKTVYWHVGDWDELRGRDIGEKLVSSQPLPSQFPVVPVLYLTVATLNAWTKVPLTTEVSRQRAQTCVAIFDRFPAWTRSAFERQIDADWTPATRAVYFDFLRALRKLLATTKCTLSVTIRLNQYRDRLLEGVPPVSRGVLLTYGAGDPQDPNSRVLDPNLVAQYVRPGSSYPFPLAVALPEYGEVRQFNPFHRLVALAPEPEGLAATPPELLWPAGLKVWPEQGPGWAQAVKRVSWAGLLWLEGDQALVDAPTPAQVHQVCQILRRAGLPTTKSLVLFDYSQSEWRSSRHEAFVSALP